MAAKGAPSLVPTARNPSGREITRLAVAHPDLVGFARPPHAVEQGGTSASTRSAARSEFAMVRGFDRAAQDIDHGLLAVADAEHRQAEVEDGRRRRRRAFCRNGRRAARQDDGLRAEVPDRRCADIERGGFPNRTPDSRTRARDQLRHLRARNRDIRMRSVMTDRADRVGVTSGPAYISRRLRRAYGRIRPRLRPHRDRARHSRFPAVRCPTAFPSVRRVRTPPAAS